MSKSRIRTPSLQAGSLSEARPIRRVAVAEIADYRLEHHQDFLRRVAAARTDLSSGTGVRLEDLRRVCATTEDA